MASFVSGSSVVEDDGGFELDFLPPLDDDLICAVCHLALKEPVQTICGHRFCKQCLAKYHRSSSRRLCPMDNKDLGYRVFFPDVATERKILSHRVKCPNKDCRWTGEPRRVKEHRAGCKYELIACPTERCTEKIARRDIQLHKDLFCPWRKIKCDYCKESVPSCKRAEHQLKCPKFPVKCPNGCRKGKVFLVNEQVARHLKLTCPLTEAPCQFKGLGCMKKFPRCLMSQHLKQEMQQHLELACNRVEQLEGRVARGTPFLWKITEFQRHIQEAKDGDLEKQFIHSDPFYTGPYGYKIKLRMYPDGELEDSDDVSVFYVIMKGEYDAILPWPFIKKVRFTIIDQQGRLEDRQNIIQETTIRKPATCLSRPTLHENDMGFGFPSFTSQERLGTRKYVVDDTLFLQVDISNY